MSIVITVRTCDEPLAMSGWSPPIARKTPSTRNYSMTLQFRDVVLSRLPFHQTGGSKIRPAVVLLDVGDDDFLMAPVTSRMRLWSTSF